MLEKSLNSFNNTNLVTGIVHSIANNPTKLSRTLILANAARDTINCAFYTVQSLNNKKIPEDKRKFVAALDLVNGFFNVVVQFALGYTISDEKVQKLICEGKDGMSGLFGGLKKSMPELAKKLYKNLDENQLKEIAKKAEKYASRCSKGFNIASSLILTTVICKRMITPFLSTPIATWAKAKFFENGPDPKTLVDNTPPATPINAQNNNSFEYFNKLVNTSK